MINCLVLVSLVTEGSPARRFAGIISAGILSFSQIVIYSDEVDRHSKQVSRWVFSLQCIRGTRYRVKDSKDVARIDPY